MFTIPQRTIDDATEIAIIYQARQHNRSLQPGPDQTDATPFNERPGALTPRQWLIAKQDEFIAWAVADHQKDLETRRLAALRKADAAKLAQVDAIIQPDAA